MRWSVMMRSGRLAPALGDKVRFGTGVALCLLALLPSPSLAQAWTTIQTSPASPADYQVAKNRDDIRAGQRTGQLDKAQARALRRQNERVGTLAATAARNGTSDSAAAFTQGAAEAVHGMIVAKRSQGGH